MSAGKAIRPASVGRCSRLTPEAAHPRIRLTTLPDAVGAQPVAAEAAGLAGDWCAPGWRLDCRRVPFEGRAWSCVPPSFGDFRIRLLQPVDLRLGGLDERVEHGHLLGILPLLVLAEAEEVGGVRRAELVEEEFVLVDDGGAER